MIASVLKCYYIPVIKVIIPILFRNNIHAGTSFLLWE